MACQGVLEHAEVFNDAVVDKRQTAALGQVRMGIGVVGRAMRGPAGMADADGAGGFLPAQKALQVVHFSLAFVQSNLAVLANKGDSGAVIASVLQSMQSFYDDGARLAMPDVTYYSTHSN